MDSKPDGGGHMPNTVELLWGLFQY